MSDQINEIIAKIKKMKEEDIPSLLSNENPIYKQYLDRFNKVYEDRIASIEKYRQNEIEAAHRLHDGMIYEIQNDTERAEENINDNVIDYLSYKYQFLKEQLPEAAKYFESQGNLINCVLNPINSTQPDSEIELSNQPLLTQEEINAALAEIKQEPKYVISGSLLRNKESGDSFEVGSQILLQIRDFIPHAGTIHRIDVDEVSILRPDSKVFRIPLTSLNMGLATIIKP